MLRLEHERVLTFEIQAAATGAFFEDEPAALHRRRRAAGGGDLSAIQDAHDYMAARGDPAPSGGAPPTRARDAMTPDPVTAGPDLPVRAAADLLVYHRVSGLPVLDGAGALVGVVSEADIIGKRSATVGEIMSRAVVAVAPDARLERVAALMTRQRVNRVPVVDAGRVVGILEPRRRGALGGAVRPARRGGERWPSGGGRRRPARPAHTRSVSWRVSSLRPGEGDVGERLPARVVVSIPGSCSEWRPQPSLDGSPLPVPHDALRSGPLTGSGPERTRVPQRVPQCR